MVPLYSIRYVGGETVPSGPVKADLGGGYYWGLHCKKPFSFGPEVFGYSKGLDPSGLMQVAVAGGLQVVAYTYFQFGLAVGYDVYRREAGASANGLLAGQGSGRRASPGSSRSPSSRRRRRSRRPSGPGTGVAAPRPLTATRPAGPAPS